MCGVARVMTLQGRQAGWHIGELMACMCHRGPNDEGYRLADTSTNEWIACGSEDTMPELGLPSLTQYEDGALILAFGHCRLSIIDLSAAGHGPMSYQDSTLWITYNGEVYNYLELRGELKDKGYTFRTSTDVEVILAAYAEWGPDCLRRFNGMFAFALWDSRRRRLFCARDRFGIKPFHYYWDGRLFAFASEIKALLAHPGIPRQSNDAIIYDYLALGSLDHTDETFFEGIKRLPSSHYLLFDLDRGSLEIRRWWDVTINVHPDKAVSGDDQEAVGRFRELLEDAVRLRLRSDVPVGTCLSGGLDSSSVVCLANRLMLEEGAVPRELVGDRQKTFSACYDDPAIDERLYMDVAIRHTGVEPNRVFPQGVDGLWQELERLVWHQEEPFGSTSIYAQWNVLRLAKERGVTVLLDGQGGDELLGGYHYYYGVLLAQLLRAGRLSAAVQAQRSASKVSGLSAPFLWALGLFYALPEPAQKRLLTFASQRFLTSQAVPSAFLTPAFVRRHRDRRMMDSKHVGEASLRERLYREIFVHSLPALLRYEDRNSMAFSLEARVPFLDHRLVEYVFSLPPHLLIHDGWTKWVLRQAMDGILPEQICWRRTKLGFATPEKRWIQEGKEHIRRLIGAGDARCAAYVNVAALRSSERLADVPGIWRLVNLEVWLRVFAVH